MEGTSSKKESKVKLVFHYLPNSDRRKTMRRKKIRENTDYGRCGNSAAVQPHRPDAKAKSAAGKSPASLKQVCRLSSVNRSVHCGYSISSFMEINPYFSYRGRPASVASNVTFVIPRDRISFIRHSSISEAIPLRRYPGRVYIFMI